MISRRRLRDNLSQAGTERSGIQTGEEERHAPTKVGDLIALRLRDAFDQAMQAQPSQVVRHLSLGEMIWGEAQERCEQRPQLMIGEPLRQKPKGDEGAEQGLDARVGETQGSHALTRNGLRLIDLLKGLFSQKAIMAEGLDVQKTSVGLRSDCSLQSKADEPQSGQVFQPFANVEVTGIVDGGFGAQSTTFLMVLLEARMFVIDMQSRGHAFGDNASAKAAWSAPDDATFEDELDLFRSTQVQVLADRRFKE